MYQIRSVQLKNGDITKEVPVIDFDKPEQAIIGEFLMADSSLLQDEVNEAVEQIKRGEKETVEWTGNRCSLTIHQDTTVIEDLFEGIADQTYPPCEIENVKLQQLMDMWQKVKESY